MKEENCTRNFNKIFLPDLQTELLVLTHSVPILELFLSVGNLKPKFKWVFKRKLKPKKFLLNCHPAVVRLEESPEGPPADVLPRAGAVQSRAEPAEGRQVHLVPRRCRGG